MLLLQYYVPATHLQTVNTALFALGLGKYQNYDCCAWMVSGKGQFRPLAGSNPHLGSQDKVELVDEYKVELICPEALKQQAVNVLLEAHPYETPAYGFIRLEI